MEFRKVFHIFRIMPREKSSKRLNNPGSNTWYNYIFSDFPNSVWSEKSFRNWIERDVHTHCAQMEMDQVLRKSVGKERSAGTTRFGTRWRSLRKIEEFASNLDGKRTLHEALVPRCVSVADENVDLVGLGFQIFSTCSLLSSPSPPLPPFLLI